MPSIGKWTLKGYQADIDFGGLYTGNVHDERGRGPGEGHAVLSRRGQVTRVGAGPTYKVVGNIADPTLLRGVMNVNGWNRYHIIARGPVLMQLINDQLLAVAIDEDPKGSYAEGLIGLQMHTGPALQAPVSQPDVPEDRGETTVRLRHVLQLTAFALATMPLHTDAAGQAGEQGFTTLFNGKDLTGWVYGRRGNGAENKSGQGYQIENGVLYSTKDDGGNLLTEKQYADFVLRLDSSVSPGRQQRHRHPLAAQGKASRVRRHRDPGARRHRREVRQAPAPRSTADRSTTSSPSKYAATSPAGGGMERARRSPRRAATSPSSSTVRPSSMRAWTT